LQLYRQGVGINFSGNGDRKPHPTPYTGDFFCQLRPVNNGLNSLDGGAPRWPAWGTIAAKSAHSLNDNPPAPKPVGETFIEPPATPTKYRAYSGGAMGEPWGSDGGVTHKNRQQEATSGNAKYRQSIDL